ncbi:MAG TPA: porin, partial [Kofleriaceae bacterium]|nr:porin [Kofleriaceae bacterium]
RAEIATLRTDVDALRAKVAELDATGGSEARRLLTLVEALATRVEALDRAVAAQGDALSTARDDVRIGIEEQAGTIGELRRDMDALTAQIGALPVAEHDGGFRLRAGDGYALRIGGYTQGRWSASHRSDTSPELQAGGFALRRTRVILDGDLGKRLSFRTMIELVATPLLWDGWADVKLGHGLSVRAGRDKTPFTRTFLAGASNLTFTERPVVVDQFRWGRDLGVQLRGAHGAVEWSAGVTNGAVEGAVDRMPAASARVAYAVAGKLVGVNPGDTKGTKETSVTIGVDGVIDAPTVPAAVGSTMIDPDPEKNGTPTRVKVQAASADLTVRRRGLEVSVEGLVRRDDWRDALRTAPALLDVLGESTPVAMAVYGDVTYMVVPGRLLGGVRVAAGELPVLSVRQATTVPRGRDVLELALTAMGIYDGKRALNATYTFLDYGPAAGASEGSREHRFVIEGQLNL